MSANKGWGIAPWGDDPWGGVSPADVPDINWSFEVSDGEDPPGADKWTHTLSGDAYLIALFADVYEYESWLLSGYKFSLGTAVYVADFTRGDGTDTMAESFETEWMGNTYYMFSLLGSNSVIALFDSGLVDVEDMSGKWGHGAVEPTEYMWAAYRSSFTMDIWSTEIESATVNDHSTITIAKSSLLGDRPVYTRYELALQAGSYSPSDIASVLNTWFSDSGPSGWSASVVGSTVKVTAAFESGVFYELLAPSESSYTDAWPVFGFMIGSLSRIVTGDLGIHTPVPDADGFETSWGSSGEIYQNMDDRGDGTGYDYIDPSGVPVVDLDASYFTHGNYFEPFYAPDWGGSEDPIA